MLKILLAEDDSDLRALVSSCLSSAGYDVCAYPDGEAALSAFYENSFSLVISDIMMPRLGGFALAEAIREINKEIPILFMTAKDDKPSKLYGYKLGIDDYVTKPFDIDLFLVKIEAILRRVGIDNSKEITVGKFRINSEERSASQNGEEIPLTAREFNILFKLLSYPKKTFTRSALMEEFWDYDSSATSRTVDVYMAKLREKCAVCDGFEIVTVHGLGYKLVMK